MNNVLFYAATVLIWGSTWIGIKLQLGSVDPMVSVAYRFALAALLLHGWCRLRGIPMRFPPRAHLFMALQGSTLFAINYWLFYLAETTLTSGLAALVFSTIVVMNVVNAAVLLGAPLEPKVIAGALLGLGGIVLVFRPELASFTLADRGVSGLLLALAATALASFGNILSARNQKEGLPVVQTNAWGMTYGALLMLLLAAVGGRTLAFDLSAAYVGSLLYLALFGSVIAFGCYLTLVGRIGAPRASYATLLFPLVALGISTLVEGYRWTPEAFGGMVLILAGNLLVLQKRKAGPSLRPQPALTEPG